MQCSVLYCVLLNNSYLVRWAVFGEGGKALQSKQGEVLFFIGFLVWDNRTGEGRTEATPQYSLAGLAPRSHVQRPVLVTAKKGCCFFLFLLSFLKQPFSEHRLREGGTCSLSSG